MSELLSTETRGPLLDPLFRNGWTMVEDRDAKYVQTITLGYTFYEIDLPDRQAALETDGTKDVN